LLGAWLLRRVVTWVKARLGKLIGAESKGDDA
jgi:hypothetical protein